MRERRDMLNIILDNMRSELAFMREYMTMGAKGYEIGIDQFEKYCRATEKGEPVAWINFATPPELFWAMDIVPVVFDGLCATAARMGYGPEYIDIAEQHVADHICSDNKVHMGLALTGDIPHPDILVYPSAPCDSNRSALPALAEYCGFPSFCIDLPYFRSERCYQYVAGELKRLVSVLEEITNRKLDVDKLKQVMEYSNLAHEYYLKLDELRQAIPCPYSSLDTYLDGGLLIALAGTPELADYYKARYDTTKDKVARKEGHLPEERIRLVWVYGLMVYDMTIFPWLEQQYGAATVSNMNSNWVMKPVEDISDYDKILRGLAEKSVLMPMNREVHGPWENFIDATVDLCRRFRADAAVFTGHVACKSNWAVMKLIKDKIEDELGIPMLILEMDLFDPRLISSDGIKAKFEDFFETVLRR